MTELSLCMIVKNEEERLARCLSGVQGAVDEIIIVDTGSTDGTKRVAGQLQAASMITHGTTIFPPRATHPSTARQSRLFSGWTRTTWWSAAKRRS